MTNFGIVLIDDLRSFVDPEVDALVIRTLPESLAWLETLTPEDTIDQLWLDHDLGKDENGEIMEIPKFVSKLEGMAFWEEAPVIHHILVHTSNSVGSKNIADALGRFFKLTRIAQSDLDTYLIQTVHVDQD